jgi:elongation factor Ts
MNITAADVNKLRKQTGAGMMDCKKALVEANGDFEAAIDFLRAKGQKVAAKRSDRDAAEGLVIAKSTNDGTRGAMIVLNCETDFVAKNDAFGEVANSILDLAIETNPSNLDALMALNYPGSEQKIADKITEEIGKIGEKIELSAYESVNASKVVAYNHPGNKLASVVGFNNETGHDVARDVAMQVAAMDPVSLDRTSVPQEVVDRELQVGKDQAIEEGKPEEMAEKIAQGRLNKFFKENTLLSQSFIKDNKKSVEQYLKEQNSDLTVTEFKRISLG